MDQAIQTELNRLSLQIALIRYDITEKLLQNHHIGTMQDETGQLAILLTQRHLLRVGRFKELPYPIQNLYSTEINNKIGIEKGYCIG